MRGLVLLALVLTIGVAACGGDDEPEAAPATWDGVTFPYPEDGVLPVEEFRAYADSVDEDWERDPAALAYEYTRARTAAAAVDGSQVTLLRDNLEDDSVRSERFVLVVEQDGDEYRLVSARRDQRCHEGRGHQGWSAALCV